MLVVTHDASISDAFVAECRSPEFVVDQVPTAQDGVAFGRRVDVLVVDRLKLDLSMKETIERLRSQHQAALVMLVPAHDQERFSMAIGAGAHEVVEVADGAIVTPDLPGVVRRSVARRVNDPSYMLRSMLDALHDGVVTLDRNRVIQVFNPAAERIYAHPAADVIGQNVSVLAPTEQLLSSQTAFFDQLFTGTTLPPTVSTRLRGDGIPMELQFTGSPIRNGLGEIVGACVMFRDITSDRRHHEELQQLANRDELTGVLNRRAFATELQRHIEPAGPGSRRGSLLLIDLDNFKQHNDSFGHAAGDELLRAVAQVMQRGVRSQDVIGRLGGDEFVILLTDAELEEAETVAARLVGDIRNHTVTSASKTGTSVTASIGVVAIGSDVTDAFAVLDLADRAMYDAKARGRDRWERR